MDNSHVLVVHSDADVRRLVLRSLDQDRLRLSLARDEEEGLSILAIERVHVLIAGSDVAGDAEAFVRRAATIQPLMGVVLIGDPARAKPGRYAAQSDLVQYIPRPVAPDSLRAAVEKAVRRQVKPATGPECRQECIPVRPAADPEPRAKPDRIIAASKPMREILELARRCAPTEMPVLISGEPDTGKELVAREIHRCSRRAAGPLVRVACASLREPDLGESLFGDRATPGLLAAASGGTLFLDNVSHLPPWAQVKLLDALQQGPCNRPGDGEDAAADVRVIASTTADLAAAAPPQPFLSRLHYYLSAVQIRVPPLRHRPQDIRPLAELYLASANAMRSRHGESRPCRLAEDALTCLLEYDWPGNILQLASVIAHVVLLSDRDNIGRESIIEAIGQVAPRCESESISVPLAGGLKEIERAVIETVLQRCRGNKAAAARALQLHRRTLYRLLQDEAPAAGRAPSPPLVFGDAGVIDSAANAVI